MGISVDSMLRSDYFRHFQVVAGHKGLNKHIQGIAVLDAPDGFNWTTGREFVVSSGFVFTANQGLVKPYVDSGTFGKCSCVGIKLGRYLSEMPADVVAACNQLDIPLLSIPAETSWMGIMNALNVLVMNKNIQNFDIGKVSFNNLNDLSYHVRKIQKILNAVESEMDFPAMVYYLSDDKVFYSSGRFKEISAGMKPEDFWEPPAGFSKEMLCDNLKMARYRIFDDRYDKPYSWITVPITVDNKVRAYFVVLEATGLIDYYDQYALRTGYVLLQELYEQILVTQSVGDVGFETFVKNLLEGKLDSPESIRDLARELNLPADETCHVVLLEQPDPAVPLLRNRDLVRGSVRMVFGTTRCRVAVMDDHRSLLLFSLAATVDSSQYLKELTDKLHRLEVRLRADLGEAPYVFGISDIPAPVAELRRSHDRCVQALSLGTILFPEERFHTYSSLGPFAWLHVEPDEITVMRKDLQRLMGQDDHGVLIKTLRVYLESRMNFSLTAKQLYAHINTIRRRMDEISSILALNLEDPLTRLKLEILLRLV